MTALDASPRPSRLSPTLFAGAVLFSAGLVFLVQPMVAKLALPLLGGSPSVWNTSMVFFQAALLVGYAYAHLLQRIGSLRTQAAIHVAVLVLAAVVLPLRVSEMVGPPSSTHPNLWLLAMLAASVGAPFAALSATAPLVQAWYARVFQSDAGKEPYVLYAASNLGSLVSLLAYPILVEPTLTLHAQRWSWSAAYAGFALLMAALALLAARAPASPVAPQVDAPPSPTVRGRERLAWIALAAVPSSLMLGVTTHITTDVASAPFLWVLPLALYLVTFIVAFQARPAISPQIALMIHAAAIAVCVAFLPFKVTNFLLQLAIHLATFFFSALVCHQALVARRPPPARLTEFYLCMSLGGVIGGAFTALLAPVVFSNVWEYPIVLALACLARPMGAQLSPARWCALAIGVAMVIAAPLLSAVDIETGAVPKDVVVGLLLGGGVIATFLVSPHKLLFTGLIVLLMVCAHLAGDRGEARQSWRSFFGVVRQSETTVPGLGGTVRMLAHGTTLHGAQAQDPRWRCRPLVYYAPETPIGQVFVDGRRRKAALRIGAVGLGTGAVAAYVRPTDHLTFFEIDPQVIRISTDPKHFSYTTECAKGVVDYRLGDARLTLAKEPQGEFDILLIDAFSSDSVPVHLLTVEAVKSYLARLKPDGVLILHLSNRNLELRGPAMAVAKAAGGAALLQQHQAAENSPSLWEATEDALIIARTPQALAAFRADGRWTPSDPTQARPWTDDYTNLVGALYARMKEKWDRKG